MKTQYTCTPDIERSGDITECEGSEGTRDRLKRLRDICGSVVVAAASLLLQTNTVAQVSVPDQSIANTILLLDGKQYTFFGIYDIPNDNPDRVKVLKLLAQNRKIYAQYLAFEASMNNKIARRIDDVRWSTQIMGELPGIISRHQLMQYFSDGNRNSELKAKLDTDPTYANTIIWCIMVAMDLNVAELRNLGTENVTILNDPNYKWQNLETLNSSQKEAVNGVFSMNILRADIQEKLARKLRGSA